MFGYAVHMKLQFWKDIITLWLSSSCIDFLNKKQAKTNTQILSAEREIQREKRR
jgi:hypothetical protein